MEDTFKFALNTLFGWSCFMTNEPFPGSAKNLQLQNLAQFPKK